MIRSSFFRQSAWMLFASLAGGGLLALVHRIAGQLSTAGDYGLFTNVLNSMQALTFPSLGLAAVFTQMTAMAKTEEEQRDVATAAKQAAVGMVVYWVLICVAGFAGKAELMAKFKITNTLPLIWLAPTLLVTLLNPIALGIVQGRQEFLWAGISAIAAGAGRLFVTWLAVTLIGASAGWAICGVFMGLLAGFAPLVFASRPVWRLRGGTFRFGPWMKNVIPLTAGLAAFAFLFGMDQAASRLFLSESENDLYGAAGAVGRVVMWIAAPLVVVMFPKLVGASSRIEDRSILFQALGATLAVSGGVALACTIVPSLPLLLLQGKTYADSASPLVPVYVWCLLPLTLANVLANNLLARKRYTVVLPLALVVAGYWLALRSFHSSPRQIILVMGSASSAALLVCIAATWLQTGGNRAAHR